MIVGMGTSFLEARHHLGEPSFDWLISKPSNYDDVASSNETFNLKQHLMVWLKRSRCFQYRTAFLGRSDS
jgi:hypothetical protein